ncbi:MAG: LPXTG cell wall anchor domain-containing protein, partial [Clostridiaceae bacterium]|nr:LPXTG cell wall anchor domain-containing protein [Clostridiaceae bacterium]
TVSPGTGSNYSSGTTVQLSATPAEGWEFEGWQGDVVNASNQIIMNSNKSVTAVFTKIITLEDEPTPEATASEPEITELDDEEAPAAPADVTELPKTGGMPAGIFYGLGGLIAALGAMLRRKTIR